MSTRSWERGQPSSDERASARSAPIYETISPTLKWLLTVCIMMATIMQALDTTIANVALPYMQGSLATTQDQINWVLTSYIVAAAIMTSPLGWMATRFGRKKLFIVCTAGFTVASMLCGVALSIEQMVAYRLLAGRVRRGARALEPGGDARHLPARQARLGDGDLGHGRDARPDHGSDARRLADRLLFVALGVLRQSALRHSHHRGPLGLHERDADAARRAVLLVRLPEPVARHRLAADDARSRRAARLVRVAGNLDRDDPRDRRLLFLPRRLPDLRAAVHQRPHLQGLELFHRPCLHVPGWHHAACEHGAGDPVHSEPAQLPGAVERLSARHARHRHIRGHVPGRQDERQGRSSDHDPHRPRALVFVALPHGRLEPRRFRTGRS